MERQGHTAAVGGAARVVAPVLPPRLDKAVTDLQLALGRALSAHPHVAVEVVAKARTALAMEVRAVVQGELARASGGYRVG